ncbi:hypothetical protein GCM10010919_07850 [Alishewanella longhuensis]|uniref:Uncharacterized protein n=1 Tax=Alishewanella longhuensis TaxID=1091037 RepID=A0ABQ3KWR6_9ALTE|nr:hypothetical protein [Alishewanella longhuensis]GHG62498.1 hypothetical protein GCM10010919_07850 [Alishewanella longhuensis]
MDLVTRYIAAVQRELPENKRDEIGRELNANIRDQLDALAEQKGELSDDDSAAVLLQMGHPRDVAQQFVPPQPLISLAYMPVYRYTLYMVLGILFVLQIIASTSAWLHSQFGLLLYLKSVASGFIGDACLAFTAITVTYMLLSREPAAAAKAKPNWHPRQLPAVGPGWQTISLQNIFTDLGTYAFLLVMIWYPLWFSPEQLDAQRISLSEPARQFLAWCTPVLLAGIVLNIGQLKQRFWNRPMLMANILVNSALVVILLYLAINVPLLQIKVDVWPYAFDWESLQFSIVLCLLITACFPAYELGRDLLRLKRLASSQVR